MSAYASVSMNPLMYYQMLPYFLCPPNTNTAQPHEGEVLNQLRMSVLANQVALSQVNQVIGEIVKNGEEGGTGDRRKTQNGEFERKLLENIVSGFKIVESAITGCQNAQQPPQDFSEIETMLENQQKVLEDHFGNLATNTANISRIGDGVESLTKIQGEEIEGLTNHLANLTALVMETRSELSQLSQMVQEDLKNLTRLVETTPEPEPEPTPEPLLCPLDFTYLDGECFYVSTEVLNWNEARKFCRTVDGELAIPREPLAFILMLNSTNILEGYWIGGKRAPSESVPGRLDSEDPNESFGKWAWLSGTPVDHGWLSGRPTPTENMGCMGVFGRGIGNENCNAKMMFVCELDEKLLKEG